MMLLGRQIFERFGWGVAAAITPLRELLTYPHNEGMVVDNNYFFNSTFKAFGLKL